MVALRLTLRWVVFKLGNACELVTLFSVVFDRFAGGLFLDSALPSRLIPADLHEVVVEA